MASSTTQSHLDIEDIRENLVILKNGNVALILETSALNFELLSEEEQDARILNFAGLLNSLTYLIQIVVHTERTDVSKYLERLRSVQAKQNSRDIQRQIEIYIRFIKNLTVNNEVLDKRFFVVIPALFRAVKKPSLISSLFGRGGEVQVNIEKVLSRAQLELYPKRDHLTKLLKRMGLEVKQLNTDELIKLFYSMYDPDKASYSQVNLTKSQYTADIIRSKKNL